MRALHRPTLCHRSPGALWHNCFYIYIFLSIGGSSCGKTTKWIPNDWCQLSVTLPRCNMAFRKTKTEKGGRETKRQPQKTERVGGNKNKPTHKHPPKKNGDVTKTSSATKVLSRAVLGTSETSAVTQTSARSKRKQNTKSNKKKSGSGQVRYGYLTPLRQTTNRLRSECTEMEIGQ